MTTNRSKTVSHAKSGNSTINLHHKQPEKGAKNENKLGLFIIVLLVSALIYAANLH